MDESGEPTGPTPITPARTDPAPTPTDPTPTPAAPTPTDPTPTPADPAPTVVAPTGTIPGAGRRRSALVAAGLVLLALGGAAGWLARGAATPTSEAAAPTVTVTVTPTTTVPPLPVAGPPIVPTTSTTTADGPVLGRRGGGTQRGYGIAQPTEIDGGASSAGVVTGITWRDWGEDRATGRGTALYVADDEPNARGVQDRATVVAFDLGDCDGQEAYRRVAWYFPQHGQEFQEDGALATCDGG